MRVIRRVKAWMASDDCDGIPADKARQATLDGLIWYAEHRGYKPGWAACKYKAIYGCWPNGEAASAKPEVPSDRLVRWINQQNAIWATAKRLERIVKENES